MLLLCNIIYAQKYKFELNENIDIENKNLFHLIQLEFNNFKTPYKNTLIYDNKIFYINSDINVYKEEFEIFLYKHGYTIKNFEKIE